MPATHPSFVGAAPYSLPAGRQGPLIIIIFIFFSQEEKEDINAGLD